jgi:hypothetical protein
METWREDLDAALTSLRPAILDSFAHAVQRSLKEEPKFSETPPPPEALVERSKEELEQFVDAWLGIVRESLFHEGNERRTMFFDYAIAGAYQAGSSLAGLLYISGQSMPRTFALLGAHMSPASLAPAIIWYSEFFSMYLVELVKIARRVNGVII